MIKARAQKLSWGDNIQFLLMDLGDKVGYVTDLIISTKKDGEFIEPSFQLSYEYAQQLMDDLWTCGLRPTEGSGSAGAMAATQKHLEDMRKLVFEK